MLKKNWVKNLIAGVGIAVLSVVLTLVGVKLYFENLPIPLDNVIRVSKLIDSEYVGEYDPEKIEENMINAIISGLDDKYAVYYNGENAEETMQKLDGYYIGIGVEVLSNTDENKIEVVSAYGGSPAEKAGIKSGDFIIGIDGKEFSAETMADAVVYMKGSKAENPLEEEIVLTIERDGEILEFKLKRARVDLYKVEKQIIDGICYIEYGGFTENSMTEFKKIVESLDSSVKGIVVDIRNNPGGDVDSAIELCDLFLDDELIMYTVDKNEKRTEYYAKRGKCDLPLAIMVNGASASASEIFAGALQANGRAVIVGDKTYGKGVSQTVQYVNPRDPSAGIVKFTVCKNYTPDGKWIGESIIPDVNVTSESEIADIREDEVFIAAVNSLK